MTVRFDYSTNPCESGSSGSSCCIYQFFFFSVQMRMKVMTILSILKKHPFRSISIFLQFYNVSASLTELWIGIVLMPIRIWIRIYILIRPRSGSGLASKYTCWKVGEKIYFYSQRLKRFSFLIKGVMI